MSTTTRPPRIAIRNLCVLAYRNGFTLYHYKASAIDDIWAPGYFNDACDMLHACDNIHPGDHMHVSAPDGNAILAVESVVDGRVVVEDVRVNKFTPGPWTIWKDVNVIANEGRRTVANTGGYSDNRQEDCGVAENMANAHLIAAAPDLLAALKEVLPFVEHEASLAIPRDYRARLNEIVGRARSATSKAETAP